MGRRGNDDESCEFYVLFLTSAKGTYTCCFDTCYTMARRHAQHCGMCSLCITWREISQKRTPTCTQQRNEKRKGAGKENNTVPSQARRQAQRWLERESTDTGAAGRPLCPSPHNRITGLVPGCDAPPRWLPATHRLGRVLNPAAPARFYCTQPTNNCSHKLHSCGSSWRSCQGARES